MRDMIVFTNHTSAVPSSSLHLIKCLRNVGKVVWVDIQHTGSPLNSPWQSNAAEHILGKVNQDEQHQRFAYNKHHFVQVRNVPRIRSAKDRENAILRILQSLKPLLNKYRISSPIIWASEPYIADLLNYLSGASLVYYCNEEADAHLGTDPQLIFEQEQTMVRSANIIFGSSDIICSRFPRNKTLLLPHGVDAELFCQPTMVASDMPKQAKSIAGFYGVLDQKIDYQLLHYTALNLPNWNFVFIGANLLPYYPLPRLNNIHYLGPKHHCDLPSYSQHWQASLLPYKSAIEPLSVIQTTLLEYLAVGAPVITTPAHSIESYAKYINVVESAHEMSEALKLATYEQKTPSDIVISDTWQVRSQFVSRILDSL